MTFPAISHPERGGNWGGLSCDRGWGKCPDACVSTSMKPALPNRCQS